MRSAWFVAILLVLSAMTLPLLSEGASAHSPTFPGNNTSLANATLIENPSKSWAVYTHLEEGSLQYYVFDLKAGDRLYLNLIAPTHEKGTGFNPDMAVLGPFAEKNGTLPSGIELPANYGWRTVNGSFPGTPTYEAFSPSAFYNLATFDEPVHVDGRYYVVVFQGPVAGTIHGDYGLAVGYVESFTLTDFVLIPISLLNVYQWEGQSLFQALGTIAAGFLIGLLAIYVRKKDVLMRMSMAHRFALVSGLLFLGTAANTIIQTIISVSQAGPVLEVLLTLIFIIAPLLLGRYSIRLALDRARVTRRTRIGMLVVGAVGLFVWAGLIVGPVIAMVGSFVPEGRQR